MAGVNPIDVIIVGNALNSFGFVGPQFTIEGLGLNTFGFLWPCNGIWGPSDEAISTTWVSCAGSSGDNIESCID